MEKLTIKELAPYLPFKLQWTFDGSDNAHEVMGIDITDFGVHLFSPYGDYGKCRIDEGKPLLRPLSSLTDEIEHNGERFVPIDKLELEGYVIGYNGFSITIGQEEGYSFGYAIDVYNQIIQKLHEWHFDTANLLGRYLALPIEGKEVEGE